MTINEVAKKYNLQTLEEFILTSGEDSQVSKDIWYNIILNCTEYIIPRLIEGSMTTSECKDELAAREIARQEIAKLNGETYEPKQNAKTIDERTTILEVDGLQAVIDQECRLSMLELGISE